MRQGALSACRNPTCLQWRCVRFVGGIGLEVQNFPQELRCTESHPIIPRSLPLVVAQILGEWLGDDELVERLHDCPQSGDGAAWRIVLWV